MNPICNGNKIPELQRKCSRMLTINYVSHRNTDKIHNWKYTDKAKNVLTSADSSYELPEEIPILVIY